MKFSLYTNSARPIALTSHSILLLLIRPRHPPIQHPFPETRPPPPAPSPQDLFTPPRQPIHPPSAHHDPCNRVHHSYHQPQHPLPLLPYCQQYRLDVELEEDPWDHALRHRVRLRRRRVLVRQDRGLGVEAGLLLVVCHIGGLPERGRRRRRGAGVDGGYDGEIVLILEEMLVRGRDGAVEGVQEGRVQRSKRELVDGVGEVEC